MVSNVSAKQRLVLDLRYLNQFLPDRKFKYEGLSIIPSLFQQGDYFSVFDLKSGYHHVDIHQDCWPYLGFARGVGLARRWYTFRVLPWVPCSLNDKADYISRIREFDDWMVNPHCDWGLFGGRDFTGRLLAGL